MATAVLPSFLLRGLEPYAILAEYQAGAFNRPIPTKMPLSVTPETNILAPSYGGDASHPIFAIKDRNGQNIILATTGHADYQSYEKSQVRTGGRCECCLQDFTGIPVGYPVQWREEQVLYHQGKAVTVTEGEIPNIGTYVIFYSFWTEGCFHSYQCALYYIWNMLSPNKGVSTADAERGLKRIYSLQYPEETTLLPAKDPRLLRSNGGSLSMEAWEDKRDTFRPTDRVWAIPAKREYVQNYITPPLGIHEMLAAMKSGLPR